MIPSLPLLISIGSFVTVVVFNPLGWNVKRHISVPIYSNNVIVRNADGVLASFQVNHALPTNPNPCLSYGTCGYPATDGEHRQILPISSLNSAVWCSHLDNFIIGLAICLFRSRLRAGFPGRFAPAWIFYVFCLFA